VRNYRFLKREAERMQRGEPPPAAPALLAAEEPAPTEAPSQPTGQRAP
jgi:hypothetical protein